MHFFSKGRVVHRKFAMHVVKLGGRLIVKGSSRSKSAAMATPLKMMSLLHTPSHSSLKKTVNPVVGAPKSWPSRAWSSQQIRADTGVALSDATKVRVARLLGLEQAITDSRQLRLMRLYLVFLYRELHNRVLSWMEFSVSARLRARPRLPRLSFWARAPAKAFLASVVSPIPTNPAL